MSNHLYREIRQLLDVNTSAALLSIDGRSEDILSLHQQYEVGSLLPADMRAATEQARLVDRWRFDAGSRSLCHIPDAIGQLIDQDPNAWLVWFEQQYRTQAPDEALRRMSSIPEDAAHWQPWQRSWAYLFAAKCMGDLGYLCESRAWLLAAMAEARQASDNAALAAATGALGEIFFRGGDTNTALHLFEYDEALLPPSSTDHARLLTYRGRCWLQLGQFEMAESLFHEASQLAELQRYASHWARRGLLWATCNQIAHAGSRASAARLRERSALHEELIRPGVPARIRFYAMLAHIWSMPDASYAGREAALRQLCSALVAMHDHVGANALLHYAPSETAVHNPPSIPVGFRRTPATFPSISDAWLLDLPLRPAGEVLRGSCQAILAGDVGVGWMAGWF
jgi:tetratricopeptide (TPR) repeat protein